MVISLTIADNPPSFISLIFLKISSISLGIVIARSCCELRTCPSCVCSIFNPEVTSDAKLARTNNGTKKMNATTKPLREPTAPPNRRLNIFLLRRFEGTNLRF